MEITEIPQEHSLVQLSSIEILALWRALAHARGSMNKEHFMDCYDISPNHSIEMERKLSDALEVARNNRPDLMTR